MAIFFHISMEIGFLNHLQKTSHFFKFGWNSLFEVLHSTTYCRLTYLHICYSVGKDHFLSDTQSKLILLNLLNLHITQMHPLTVMNETDSYTSEFILIPKPLVQKLTFPLYIFIPVHLGLFTRILIGLLEVFHKMSFVYNILQDHILNFTVLLLHYGFRMFFKVLITLFSMTTIANSFFTLILLQKILYVALKLTLKKMCCISQICAVNCKTGND